MSTTFKIILDKRRTNSQGNYPIRFRIFQGTGYKDFTPGITISESIWDDSAQRITSRHPECKDLNETIYGHTARLKKLLKLFEIEGKPDPSLVEIVAHLKRQENTKKQLGTDSIIKYGLELSNKLKKAGKVGNGIVYETAVNRLRKYTCTNDFSFNDLTYTVLEDWNTTMLSEGLKVNAISSYLRTIRAIYNRGIKEKFADKSAYPFSGFMIRGDKTISRTLTVEEMKLIISMHLPKAYLIPYRDLFLLSFCLIGINFADLLTLREEDIIDGRLIFHRRKTHKIYSIKIHPVAAQLIEKLKTPERNEYMLPLLHGKLNPVQLKKCTQLIVHCVNEGLKKIAKHFGIKKEVTTYYARYAWANIAKKTCGYSKDKIAEALGHEYGNKVTGIYLDNYDSDVIDEMNEKVIAAIFDEHKK